MLRLIYTLESRIVNFCSQTDANQSNRAYCFSRMWEKWCQLSGAPYRVKWRVSRTASWRFHSHKPSFGETINRLSSKNTNWSSEEKYSNTLENKCTQKKTKRKSKSLNQACWNNFWQAKIWEKLNGVSYNSIGRTGPISRCLFVRQFEVSSQNERGRLWKRIYSCCRDELRRHQSTLWIKQLAWSILDWIDLLNSLRVYKNLSMYIVNTIQHRKCFVRVYTLVVLNQKSHSFATLTCSISDSPQLVRKHRTGALSM